MENTQTENDLGEYDDGPVDCDDIEPEKLNIKSTDELHSVQSSSFADMLLKPELQRAIDTAGFEQPSEVQTECLPQALLGTDILCQAKSGMGKTLVFVLAILQQLEPSPATNQVQAIIVVHSRELAYQISHEFERFTVHMKDIRVVSIYGGVPIEKQKSMLGQGAHIIVATPGRLLQLIELATKKGKRLVDVSKVRFFVIDECDSILENLNMRRDMQKVFRKTPVQKQVMMFTATLSDETSAVCKKFMHNFSMFAIFPLASVCSLKEGL